MKTLSNWLLRGLSYTLVLGMLSIVLTVLWQVTSRYVLQDPASFTEELSRFQLIWIGLLGSAYAYQQKAHLGFNLIVQKLKGSPQRFVLLLIECLVILFAVLILIIGGVYLVHLTIVLEQVSAALEINMGIIYSVIPLTGILITFFAIENILALYPSTEKN